MNETKERLIRLLQGFGPLTNKMIGSMLGVSQRSVRSFVQDLRHSNYPIGFGRRGYFLANDKVELQHTINKFRTKNRTTVETLYDLENVEYDTQKLRVRDREEN